MTTKTWRIVGLVLMGLGVASYGIDWYVKGSLSGMGYTGFKCLLMLICHSACNIDPLSRGIGVQN